MSQIQAALHRWDLARTVHFWEASAASPPDCRWKPTAADWDGESSAAVHRQRPDPAAAQRSTLEDPHSITVRARGDAQPQVHSCQTHRVAAEGDLVQEPAGHAAHGRHHRRLIRAGQPQHSVVEGLQAPPLLQALLDDLLASTDSWAL